MKYDILEVQKDRLNEINKQIIKATNKKLWGIKKALESEKKLVLHEIKEIEESRNGRE